MDFSLFSDRVKNISPSSHIYNLSGSSMALFLALQDKPFIMIEHIEETAEELYKDILFFRSVFNASRMTPRNILFLPEPNGPESCGHRAEVIYNFNEGDSIITSKDALDAKVWPHEELKDNALQLKAPFEMSRDVLEQKLIKLGYKRVSIVVEHGEFSRRGWLFDIFPSTHENPFRVEFFGDTIDKIRTFDINTQKSVKDAGELIILPAAEPLEGTDIFSMAGDINYFFPDSIHPPYAFPEGAIMLSKFSFSQRITEEGAAIDAGLLPMEGHGIYHNERKSIYELPHAIKKISRENRIVIVVSSTGQAERIRDVLMSAPGGGDVVAPVVEKEEISEYKGSISITIGELSSGFFLPGLLILTEKEIFGERPAFRSIKKSKVSELLISLDDLAVGDFIVHKDHGIGKFAGLVKQTVEGYEGDLMVLEYSGGDRLYLPLYAIEKIKKYHAEEGVLPKADRLGGKTWQRTKERVKKKIREMAEKLLRLYAEREVSKGFVFSGDTELHTEFDDFFHYDETPDQARAIEEIKSDMETERPMDRLLCGDVGYGKTEVAMRAAFKAVYDARQVAVLVPTTLLCEQHYRTFKQRFSAFPVTIGYLSRFKSRHEQSGTIKEVANGDIDILIGTHTLLRKDISFHNLGLLVIDEEHRFGVAQKEKIKELKRGVDVLTLTATPIPRTLNMALSGIRGMSLIETPPEERLAVRSIVTGLNEQTVKDAIEREMERGGQTYFVHNRIKDIGKIFDYVKRVAPEARVAVAHGQMHERELEKVMKRFIDGEIDVLVSTAIIGSGLDIPSANTIIINMADRMGLADLYQLKGRVGRSNVRAYAYFLVPGEDIITDEAKKRLQAIQDMNYLGAGFRLAMKDLEIRGTGNMLGPEQSGHIHAVGFDMYVDMLENSVAELRGIKTEEEIDPRISLRVSAFIPDEFIEDITLRLSIYRKIASARNDEGLNALVDEIKDRFGRLPAEVQNLFDVMRLKIMARKLKVTDIEEVSGNIRIIFSKGTKVEAENIFGLRDTVGDRIRFLPEGFEIKAGNLEESSLRLAWSETYKLIRGILEKLPAEEAKPL
ncbi:MAG: transcription-repair coupling factor (superfamily II helicase) [Nitrospirae bacterium]|nr:MAG: transcription-repair coupling factor (superfamily II helicase) [Nitrospirota bacterium]